MSRKWWKTDPSIYQHLRDGGREPAEHWPELLPRCAKIMAHPGWAEQASNALTNPDDDLAFGRAVQVCELLGIPTSDTLR